MKRAKDLYHHICDYENLMLAFLKAVRGKHDRPEVVLFKRNFARNMEKIRKGLIRHEPDIGNYRYFRVHDPKPRSICAASFPERVLHHAVMNVCEPVFDRYAIYDSYACRKGKGGRKALERALKWAAVHPWYLKLDIQKYFDSIDHGIMMHCLGRRIKDPAVLDLFDKILNTYQTEAGKGLPIGNLISQHLANLYLGLFDHWVKEGLRMKKYIRYMDDMLFWGETRHGLKQTLEQIKTFLSDQLGLTVKSGIQLNQCRFGIPYLGFRVFPRGIRLSPAGRDRFVKKFRQNEANYAGGIWTEQTLVRHMEPLIGFTRTADAAAFRNQVIDEYGVLP